jgi:hypothetical protein
MTVALIAIALIAIISTAVEVSRDGYGHRTQF